MNNRQIKLRAWDGSEMIYPYGKGFNNILTNGNILDRFSIVMQYTGLKDKNGKEIYEGDILSKWYSRDLSGNDIIKWNEEVEFETANEWAGFNITFLDKCEIIGNIYEQPHLINEKNT